MFSMLEALIKDPKWFFEYSLYRVPAVLIAIVLHEWAHGYVAYRLGDPTAKSMGRLSLNPLKHLDPLGTILMFFLGFGWAKPVPINPAYYKNPRRDDFLVSIAGVTMNLLLFLLFSVLAVVCNNLLWSKAVLQNYSLHELLGFNDGFINVILGGYGKEFNEFFARPELLWVVRLTSQIAFVNLGLAVFNLIPVPPLDGYHVLNDLVLKGKLFASQKIAGAGMAIIMVLSFTGVLSDIMSTIMGGIQSGVLSAISFIMGA